MNVEQRRALCEGRWTLNGKPATVSGYLNTFATVTQLDTGLSCEWAWPTVLHIGLNKEGKFTS